MVKLDVLEAAGTPLLCTGQEAGSEAAVYAMHHIFEDAILLIDVSNAFNCMNRNAALQNIHYLCPPFAVILTNTYREDVQLFINGETLHSCERTTQGDPLAMAMYAIGILPIVHQLQSNNTKQTWFATAGGCVDNLHHWWSKLCGVGPSFG